MAAAGELASIVAAYLRKHGFSKTLAAFFRESGDTPEEKDIVDLETLYKLYNSTQVNGDTTTRKSKKTKLEDTPDMAKGNQDVRDTAEEKVNGGASSERKKKKKGEKENHVDSPMVPKIEAKNIPKEGSKKKRKEDEPEEANETIEDLKPKVENCLPVAGKLKPSVEEALSSGHAGRDSALNKIVVGTRVDNGGGLAIQQEVAHPPKSLNKRSKKEKKEQGGGQMAGSETQETRLADNIQVSSQEDGLSKKKRKNPKDGGAGEETEDAITAEPACKTPINGQTEKVDAMKQPVESLGKPGGCGTSSKKKKKRKELSLEGAGDVNGSIQEPSDAKLEAIKNEEELIDSKTRSGKKRKHKEDTSPVNGILNHDHNNSTTSPEKTKEAGGGEVVHDCNVEKHESGSTKTKKHKETPNDKKTPTGALAFQRIEVDKVSFSDPRLSDNSYWAKNGAEEGYGAKAQEVLGLVRGRDFRHEKTKKKRGSYRGGLIGLESHSIKFENSDED